MTCYGHAALALTRCARGCDRAAVCISDVDKKHVCVVCAVEEERANAS